MGRLVRVTHGQDAPPPDEPGPGGELHPSERVARAAKAADGPLDRAALRAIGLTDDAIDHRLRTGSLRRVHRGVRVPGHDVLVQRGHWRAALHACGDAGGLSHATGLAAWDVRASAGRLVHVSVPGNGGRRHRRDDLVVHRARGMLERDVVEVDGLRVTSLAWTIRDVRWVGRTRPRASGPPPAPRTRTLRGGPASPRCLHTPHRPPSPAP